MVNEYYFVNEFGGVRLGHSLHSPPLGGEEVSAPDSKRHNMVR